MNAETACRGKGGSRFDRSAAETPTLPSRPPLPNCQPIPTLATGGASSHQKFVAVVSHNSLSINRRRARSCPIVLGGYPRLITTSPVTCHSFVLASTAPGTIFYP